MCSAPATPSCPASCAAGSAARACRPPRPGPMPAAPSPCRGCSARRNIPTWEELQFFLKHGSQHHALRKDEAINHIHWATTRRRDIPSLMALAIDHRIQLEEIAERAERRSGPHPRLQGARGQGGGAGRRRPPRLRHAARREAMAARRCSIRQAATFLARPPGRAARLAAAALRIRARISARSSSNGRSTTCIKCLCFYHPDDPAGAEGRAAGQAARACSRRRARSAANC